MNQLLTEAVDRCAAVDSILELQGAEIIQLQQELLQSQSTLTFPALQAAPWEMLWGLGRSKPMVTNDHGTAAFVPGEPARIIFFPKTLATRESDNLYCVRRLAPYLPGGMLERIRKVTYSLQVGLSDLSACQAIECEWQRQIGLKVWNGGLQFFPGPGTAWTVRAFDYIKGDWEPLGITINSALLAPGKPLDTSGEFTLSDAGVSYDTLTINGLPVPMNFNQAIGTAKVASEQFNVAFQCDALQDAKSYQANLGRVTLKLEGLV